MENEPHFPPIQISNMGFLINFWTQADRGKWYMVNGLPGTTPQLPISPNNTRVYSQ